MKFEVGEICLAKLRTGHWVECEVRLAGIIATRARGGGTIVKDYAIKVPSYPRAGDGLWGCNEEDLRKKKPPEQLDDKEADDGFKKDLQRMINGYVYE